MKVPTLASLRALASDSLYRNSFFLMSDQGLLALLGFTFWAIAAHLTTSSAIGATYAALGVATLLGAISNLGIANTVTRFSASARDRVGFERAGLIVVVIASSVSVGIWSLLPGHPGLGHELASHGGVVDLIMWLVVIAVTSGGVLSSAIISRRQSHFVLIKDMMGMGARFALLPLIATSGAIGAFFGYAIGSSVAVAGSLIILWFKERPDLQKRVANLRRSFAELREKASFVFSAYLSNLASIVPTSILPALIVAHDGSSAAAYVAIPVTIVGLLNFIPSMTSTSMLAELAHHPHDWTPTALKSLRAIYIVAMPSMVILWVAAPLLLRSFGHSYSTNGTTCLRWMVAASIFSCANYVADNVLLALRRVGTFLAVNVLGSVAVLVSLVLSLGGGPNAIGFGWFIGQAGYMTCSMIGLLLSGVIGPRRPAGGLQPVTDP